MGVQVKGAIKHGEGDVVSHLGFLQVGNQTVGRSCAEHEAQAERSVCLDRRQPDEARGRLVERHGALDWRPWRFTLKLHVDQVDLVRGDHGVVDAVRVNLGILDASNETSLLEVSIVHQWIAAEVEISDARERIRRILVCNGCGRINIVVDSQGSRMAKPRMTKK